MFSAWDNIRNVHKINIRSTNVYFVHSLSILCSDTQPDSVPWRRIVEIIMHRDRHPIHVLLINIGMGKEKKNGFTMLNIVFRWNRKSLMFEVLPKCFDLFFGGFDFFSQTNWTQWNDLFHFICRLSTGLKYEQVAQPLIDLFSIFCFVLFLFFFSFICFLGQCGCGCGFPFYLWYSTWTRFKVIFTQFFIILIRI